jgi:hypothetical protein
MAQHLSLADRGRAHRLGELSLKVSLVGIIVTVIVALIVGGACHSSPRCWDRMYLTSSNCSSGYEIAGQCYSHRRSVAMLTNCQKSFDTCCLPSEDVYYRQYCYTLMNVDQQGNVLLHA